MKRFLLLIISLFSFTSAQNDFFASEDIVLNAYRNLSPNNFKQISWVNSKTVSVIDTIGEKEFLYIYDIESGIKTDIMNIDEFRDIYKSVSLNTLRHFPQIGWIDLKKFSFFTDSTYYHLNLENKEIIPFINFSSAAEDITLSPDRKFIAYTESNNLFISEGIGTIIQVTYDGKYGIVNGKAVHRNEFGIDRGIFWSPDNKKIAFYRMDETMVTDYPLIDNSVYPAITENIKYPMAGQTSHKVKIGIFDLSSRNTVWIEPDGTEDKYLASVTWDPSGRNIYCAVLNRDQNHLELQKFDAANGNYVKTLFEESDDKYVEPENPLFFLPKKDSEFLWLSERDGWNHLYLYDTSGTIIKQVTSGNWEITSVDGFSPDGKMVFFNSTKDSPLENHYYSADISSGKIAKITSGSGTHNINAGPAKKYFIDNFNSFSVPREIRIVNRSSDIVKTMLAAPDPLKDFKLGKSLIGTLKASDNTDLYYNLILPADFDSSKKYPAIVYVYGGPHLQLVTNTFTSGRYALWFQQMAQKGFAVFILDNRGSANRGLSFEQATFRNLGDVEIEDQMRGVEFLKSLPYIDSSRLGVFGWSYGGFMTVSLMLKTNNCFKVGVAGGAVIDWSLYEVMYTERYMDTPQNNFSGYEKSNLLNYVDNLKGKLLLVHGTNDPTVVWQHTLLFAQKAANLNIPLDYYPYIGHGHGVAGKDAIHLYNKITNYFIDNL
ncbi:MAG: S9 family peptidase [Ignavibacteria bacterium]|nr:S9 family peptidase [Ignavibacteria bacterium]